MEQSCNVSCHGGLFGYKDPNRSDIASSKCPSGSHIDPKEMNRVSYPCIILL